MTEILEMPEAAASSSVPVITFKLRGNFVYHFTRCSLIVIQRKYMGLQSCPPTPHPSVRLVFGLNQKIANALLAVCRWWVVISLTNRPWNRCCLVIIPQILWTVGVDVIYYMQAYIVVRRLCIIYPGRISIPSGIHLSPILHALLNFKLANEPFIHQSIDSAVKVSSEMGSAGRSC